MALNGAVFFYGIVLEEDALENSKKYSLLGKKTGPIRFGQKWYYEEVGELYMGIRETHFEARGSEIVPFALPCSETAEWDRLLKERCEEWDIEWEAAAFHLVSSYYDYELEFNAILFYGHCLWEHVGAEHIGSNREDDPIWVGHMPPRDYDLERDYYYLYIRDTHREALDAREFGWRRISIQGIDTGAWDQLLEAKCKELGIIWRKPAFYFYKWLDVA